MKLADRISNLTALGFVHDLAFVERYLDETRTCILPCAHAVNPDMFRELSDLIENRHQMLRKTDVDGAAAPAINKRRASIRAEPQQVRGRRHERRGWIEFSIRGSGSSHMATTPTYSASAIDGWRNAIGTASRCSATESFPFPSRPMALASRVLCPLRASMTNVRCRM